MGKAAKQREEIESIREAVRFYQIETLTVKEYTLDLTSSLSDGTLDKKQLELNDRIIELQSELAEQKAENDSTLYEVSNEKMNNARLNLLRREQDLAAARNTDVIADKRRELAANIAARPLLMAQQEKTLSNQIWIKEKEIQYLNAEKYKYEQMLADEFQALNRQ